MANKLIVGIMGQAGSGKDTFARMLVELAGGKTLALADPLKKFCKEVFDFSDDQLYGPSESRNAPDQRYVHMTKGALGTSVTVQGGTVERTASPPNDIYLTPRYALQTLGTEWGRNCYKDVWIDYGVRRANNMLNHSDTDTVYITDVRFINEAKRLRELGAVVVRIVRPDANADAVQAAGIAGHASEAEQNDPEIDQYINYTVYNEGSLDDLRASARNLLVYLERIGMGSAW